MPTLARMRMLPIPKDECEVTGVFEELREAEVDELDRGVGFLG